MTTKQIKLKEDLLEMINLKVGSKGSWTSKITKLLNLTNKERQTSAAAKPAATKSLDLTDYKQIKKIVEDALFDMKSGKI